MPLIVEDVLRYGVSLRDGVTAMYIMVESTFLSKQYNIPLPILMNAWVEGVILDVDKVSGELTSEERAILESHVIGKAVRFYVVAGLFSPYDELYFDESSWAPLRDAGLFPWQYKIKVKLESLSIEDVASGKKKKLALYPYRDITARA